jgi:two-component system, cell cycle response regulator DivK
LNRAGLRTDADPPLHDADLPKEESIDTKTVLVADDEPDHRTIVTTLLRHYGYAVLEARTGAEAVQAVYDHQPDVVLMDAGLPVLDGWEATARLKRDPATAHIPIVIVTVHTQEADLARAAESGADTYIAKPCDPSSVVAEVERWIGAPGAPEAGTSAA